MILKNCVGQFLTIKTDTVNHFGKFMNCRFYFYFDKSPNDLALIIVIITCDACLFSLSSVRANIKKKRKKARQQLVH